mmetsp:Transcript_5548/g.9109  ORF Transcript_5548/g.9109 Transcript_5548/m.9109 type:complete len:582 (-) Transcript_5548:62-1807(-)
MATTENVGESPTNSFAGSIKVEEEGEIEGEGFFGVSSKRKLSSSKPDDKPEQSRGVGYCKRPRGRPPLSGRSSRGRGSSVTSSCGGDDDVSSYRAESIDDQSYVDDDEGSSYFYTAMPITPSHQQTARTKLSSSIRISTHQILSALMCREPQSIRQLHTWLSQLQKEHEIEMSGITSSRRTSHSAVEQAAKSTTPSVLISEQQILAILDVLQIMGLVVAMGRRKNSTATESATEDSSSTNIVGEKETVVSEIANKEGSDQPSTAKNEKRCAEIVEGDNIEEPKGERSREDKTKALTEYDCCNHFETALYTMAGNAKGPEPLGFGSSDLCARASAELGKLPILSNLHVDTDARRRNTAAVRARIEKLHAIIAQMKADTDAEASTTASKTGKDTGASNECVEKTMSSTTVEVKEGGVCTSPTIGIAEQVLTEQQLEEQSSSSISISTSSAPMEQQGKKERNEHPVTLVVDNITEKMEVDDAKIASEHPVITSEDIAETKVKEESMLSNTSSVPVDDAGSLLKAGESKMLCKHRDMFREYVKSSMEGMKRPVHPDAVDMGLTSDDDLLYRTIQFELNVCMRYTA